MGVQATRRAHRALLGSALCLTALLSGCSGDKSSAEPSPAPLTSDATEPSSEATSASPSWEQQFTSSELAAYEAAIARLASYESESEPYWARGKATSEARKLFQEYFPSPVWQVYFDRLKTYEQVDVKIVGVPTVLWSEGTRISSADGTVGSVAVRQCVDYTTQVVKQYGNPVSRFQNPVLRTATFDGSREAGWLIVELKEPVKGKANACSGAPA